VTDDYRDFAADYDWLFDDHALADGFAITRPAVADLLRRTGPGCAVLDAACGTGVDAAALARRGFHVRATDGSRAMVEAAAARFRREGLAIGVQQCLWAELPGTVEERFDVVLCTGNALVHAAGRDAMVKALTGLRHMARAGGHVVIHLRNWEKLHAKRRIVQVANRVRIRGGRRCVVLYAWEVPARLDQEHIAHIVFVFEDKDRIEPHEYRVPLLPVTLGELRERLELAGLREVRTDFSETADEYVVIATPTS
jgi:SAM-dependent methyltransferase